MYTVQWCDHDGTLQERKFERLDDACTEANFLYYHYDGVRLIWPER